MLVACDRRSRSIVLGDEHEVDARRDRARVFHHEGDELAHQPFEFLVDLVVLLQHFQGLVDVQPGEGVQRLAQLGNRKLAFEGQVGDGQAQTARHARVDQPLHRARHPGRFVADALEVGDGLADGDEQAQVTRGRLAPGDDGRQVSVDLDFHRVDHFLLGQHLRRQFAVEVGQRVDGLGELRLDEPAHLQHAGRDGR